MKLPIRIPKLRFSLAQLLLLVALAAILLLTVDTWRRHRLAKSGWYISAVAVSPDQKTLAAAVKSNNLDDPGRIQLWELPSGRPIGSMTGHRNMITDMAFVGDRLVTAGAESPTAPLKQIGEVLLWDVSNRRLRQRLQGHIGSVRCVAVSARGTIASGGDDGLVQLWDEATGERLGTLHAKGSVQSVAFSGDGETVVAGTLTFGDVHFWRTDTLEQTSVLKVLPAGPGTRYLISAAISPDASTLCTVSMGIVKLWDAKTGVERRSLNAGRTMPVYSVLFCPDGKTLAMTGARGALLHDAETGAELKRLANPSGGMGAVKLAADGKTVLAPTTTGQVWLWNTDTGSTQVVQAVDQQHPANWYLPAAAFLAWCIVWSCACTGKPTVAALLLTTAFASAMPVAALCVMTPFVLGEELFTWSFWSLSLAGLLNASLRVRRVGAAGLYFGEWLWALKGLLTGVFAATLLIPSDVSIVVFFADMALVLGLFAAPFRTTVWGRSAPWQHWFGLGLCTVYPSVLAAAWFSS